MGSPAVSFTQVTWECSLGAGEGLYLYDHAERTLRYFSNTGVRYSDAAVSPDYLAWVDLRGTFPNTIRHVVALDLTTNNQREIYSSTANIRIDLDQANLVWGQSARDGMAPVAYRIDLSDPNSTPQAIPISTNSNPELRVSGTTVAYQAPTNTEQDRYQVRVFDWSDGSDRLVWSFGGTILTGLVDYDLSDDVVVHTVPNDCDEDGFCTGDSFDVVALSLATGQNTDLGQYTGFPMRLYHLTAVWGHRDGVLVTEMSPRGAPPWSGRGAPPPAGPPSGRGGGPPS